MGTTELCDRDYFKMGAAVAIGELYDSGRLGDKNLVAEETKAYLASFGIKGMGDIERIGLAGPYVQDFERLFCCSDDN